MKLLYHFSMSGVIEGPISFSASRKSFMTTSVELMSLRKACIAASRHSDSMSAPE